MILVKSYPQMLVVLTLCVHKFDLNSMLYHSPTIVFQKSFWNMIASNFASVSNLFRFRCISLKLTKIETSTWQFSFCFVLIWCFLYDDLFIIKILLLFLFSCALRWEYATVHSSPKENHNTLKHKHVGNHAPKYFLGISSYSYTIGNE